MNIYFQAYDIGMSGIFGILVILLTLMFPYLIYLSFKEDSIKTIKGGIMSGIIVLLYWVIIIQTSLPLLPKNMLIDFVKISAIPFSISIFCIPFGLILSKKKDAKDNSHENHSPTREGENLSDSSSDSPPGDANHNQGEQK